MDSLRNAVKSFIDMDLVGYKKGTILQVSDTKQMLHVAEDIMDFQALIPSVTTNTFNTREHH